MRFLLIDRITEWQPGVRGRAVKCVALSEDFFDDHFPLKPILPGVLMIEGMAQLSGILLEEGVLQNDGVSVKALLSMVEKAKFRNPVTPGEALEYEAEVLSVNEAGGKVFVKAFVDGEPAAECSLLFSFHQIDNPHLEARRREVLDMWLRDLKPNHE